MAGLYNHGWVDALVDESFVAFIRHAHVFLLDVGWFLLQPTAAEAIEWEAIEVLEMDEKHHHHAKLGIRWTHGGQRQTIVVRAHMGISVGGVKGHSDDLAQAKVVTRAI